MVVFIVRFFSHHWQRERIPFISYKPANKNTVSNRSVRWLKREWLTGQWRLRARFKALLILNLGTRRQRPVFALAIKLEKSLAFFKKTMAKRVKIRDKDLFKRSLSVKPAASWCGVRPKSIYVRHFDSRIRFWYLNLVISIDLRRGMRIIFSSLDCLLVCCKPENLSLAKWFGYNLFLLNVYLIFTIQQVFR